MSEGKFEIIWGETTLGEISRTITSNNSPAQAMAIAKMILEDVIRDSKDIEDFTKHWIAHSLLPLGLPTIN